MAESRGAPRSLLFDGVQCIPPMEGGGETGIVDVAISRLPVANGGTDASTAAGARHNIFTFVPATANAIGDIYYRSSATAIARLPRGQPGQVLQMSIAAQPIPMWGDVTGPGGDSATIAALRAEIDDLRAELDDLKARVVYRAP